MTAQLNATAQLDSVRDFTNGSGYNVRNYYGDKSVFQRDLAAFTLKMVTSEMVEMMAPQLGLGKALDVMLELAHNPPVQGDATSTTTDTPADNAFTATLNKLLVHTRHYAELHGYNVDMAFAVVHQANMNKRFPDGTFHLRPSDGKVMKPPGFQDPIIPDSAYASKVTYQGTNRRSLRACDQMYLVDMFQTMRHLAELVGLPYNVDACFQTDYQYSKLLRWTRYAPVPTDAVIHCEKLDAIIDISYYVMNSLCKLEQFQ